MQTDTQHEGVQGVSCLLTSRAVCHCVVGHVTTLEGRWLMFTSLSSRARGQLGPCTCANCEILGLGWTSLLVPTNGYRDHKASRPSSCAKADAYQSLGLVSPREFLGVSLTRMHPPPSHTLATSRAGHTGVLLKGTS